jgi:transcriptional regulator with XRE-family HTH domain
MEEALRAAVRKTIAEKGLKHKHVAMQVDMTPQTFSNKLNGQTHYTIDEMETVAQVLGISIDQLQKDGAA